MEFMTAPPLKRRKTSIQAERKIEFSEIRQFANPIPSQNLIHLLNYTNNNSNNNQSPMLVPTRSSFPLMKLPVELFVEVISKLNICDFARTISVSREWKNRCDLAWQKLLLNTLTKLRLPFPVFQSFWMKQQTIDQSEWRQLCIDFHPTSTIYSISHEKNWSLGTIPFLVLQKYLVHFYENSHPVLFKQPGPLDFILRWEGHRWHQTRILQEQLIVHQQHHHSNHSHSHHLHNIIGTPASEMSFSFAPIITSNEQTHFIRRSNESDVFYHYITFGFSELYDKRNKLPEISGYGFELSLRCLKDQLKDYPSIIPKILQTIATSIFNLGLMLSCGTCIDFDRDSHRVAIIWDDPVLRSCNSPTGKVRFLSVFILERQEYSNALEQYKSIDNFITLAVLPTNPLFINTVLP